MKRIATIVFLCIAIPLYAQHTGVYVTLQKLADAKKNGIEMPTNVLVVITENTFFFDNEYVPITEIREGEKDGVKITFFVIFNGNAVVIVHRVYNDIYSITICTTEPFEVLCSYLAKKQ